MLICIDPGHGGNDPGATSKNGMFKEKDNVLKIAKEIVKNSYRLPDIDFLLTRQSDINFSYVQSEDLQARCDIANQAKADFFISIHQNADKNYQGQGIETYSLATTGEGRKLAEKVQSVLTEKTNLHNRGVKTANYQVLRNTNMPAILIEAGFVGGNLDEAVYVSKFETIKLFAECILQGIANYLGVNLKEENMSKFKDVNNNLWYFGPVMNVADLGIMGGYPDGTFKPEKSITRAELASALVRLHALTNEEEKINAVIRNCQPSTVTVYTDKGGGSGFFVKSDTICTNAHVVDGVDRVTIKHGNKEYQGTVERKGIIYDDKGNIAFCEQNKAIDLALIKVSGANGKPVTFAANVPDDGDFIVIIGSPLLIRDWKSLGIVSRKTNYYIDTDAAINPGNSGGAAFNLNGEFVGVPTQKYTGAEIDNMGNVIQSKAVRLWIDNKHGEIKF